MAMMMVMMMMLGFQYHMGVFCSFLDGNRVSLLPSSAGLKGVVVVIVAIEMVIVIMIIVVVVVAVVVVVVVVLAASVANFLPSFATSE